MEKIVVTGATGFIGRYVIGQLSGAGDRNYKIVATSPHPEKAIAAPWYDRVTYVPFDLSEAGSGEDLYRYFGRPDRLIHLAWEGLPNYKSDFHLEVNYPRHLAFLKNMADHGLMDITVTGTCLEYGMQEGCLKEDMETHPHNSYAKAKDLLRASLQALQKDRVFTLKWVRLFYMYGKGQNPNSLLSQLDKVLEQRTPVFNMSGGEQVRDYLPVEKVASCIVQTALQKRVTGVINCCSGRPVRIKDFVQEYLRQKRREVRLNLGYYPYPDYEPMHFWGDTEKLNKIMKDE